MMAFECPVGTDGNHLLKQILGILPVAERTRPFYQERHLLFDMSLDKADGLLAEMVMEDGFSATLFGFLEMSEVRALHRSVVTGDDSVSTLGTSISLAFLGFFYMDGLSFIVTSKSV